MENKWKVVKLKESGLIQNCNYGLKTYFHLISVLWFLEWGMWARISSIFCVVWSHIMNKMMWDKIALLHLFFHFSKAEQRRLCPHFDCS